MRLPVVQVQVQSPGRFQDSLGFLEPWLEESPVVDELVVIGKNLRPNGLVSFALEANAVTLVVSTGGLFRSLLGAAGVKGRVYVNQID